jgi:hypothetical protein
MAEMVPAIDPVVTMRPLDSTTSGAKARVVRYTPSTLTE